MRFANAEIEVVAIACARGTLVLAGLRGGVPSEKRSKRGEAHETSPPPRSLEKWLRKPEGTQSVGLVGLVILHNWHPSWHRTARDSAEKPGIIRLS